MQPPIPPRANRTQSLVAVLLNAGLLAFADCRLIDQTSFGGAPQAPAPSELAAALTSQGAVPLLAVRPDDAVPYGDALRQVIRAAEARDGSVRFRVDSVVAAKGGLRAQQSALEANTAAARQFVDDMGAAGVNADRIRLEARTDAHVLRREIRLYQE